MAATPYRVGLQFDAPVKVTVDAERSIQTLRRLGAGMRNPRPVVEEVADAIRRHIHRQFAVGGDPAWAPNAQNTIAAKGSSKPLFGKRGSSGIEAATKVTVEASGNDLNIVMSTSAVGRYMNYGRGAPVHGAKWVIVPVRAAALRFVVAAKQGQFRKARRGAQAARRAGQRVSVPGRPASLPGVAYAMKVIHPGYPARRFTPVMDEAWIQQNWHAPLGRYLFGGVA